MAVRIERIVYDCGWQSVFYVAENGNPGSSKPSVSCYTPDEARTTFNPLRLLEAGVYVFKFYFGRAGKYIFIFFEGDKPQLIAIITVKRNARN